MSEESRREFLLQMAKGAVYAAPLIRTLSAPERMAAQVPTGKGTLMSVQSGTEFQLGPGDADASGPGPAPSVPSAPWDPGRPR